MRIAGERAFLTIKGPVKGFSRLEFEYEIPLADAREMLANLCGGVVEKRRYLVDYSGHTWEVDEFYGENAGLFIAVKVRVTPSPRLSGVKSQATVRSTMVRWHVSHFRSGVTEFPSIVITSDAFHLPHR